MKPIQTFADFNFSPEMNQAIEKLGFETPTPIQIETIPQLMEGATDFLGLAATGTGKTAAFAIPLLEQLDPEAEGVQGLILCPTRELAKQVAEQINMLARFKETKALAIYGGSDYSGQLRALREGVSIVVGTPGRIIDHLERKTLNLNHLKVAILDEADEMISMGFKEEIETILETINQEVKHQTWLFSATMSKEIRRIADQFLVDPKQVAINKDTGGAAKSVSQFFFTVHEDQKPQAVEMLVDSVPDFHGLIFCQTKALVIELTQYLRSQGYPADCLHGDMEQAARERAMKAFKAKQVTIMVCTDVAARGIDVKDLTHVINFSLPREFDNYVHRIGRTGRGGKEGVAWNLVNPSHMRLITPLEKITQSKMQRGVMPDPATVLKVKIAKALAGFGSAEGQANSETVASIQAALTEGEWKSAIENMSKEEIVAQFLAKTIRVPKAVESIHEAPRRREGETREERRRSYMERTTKGGGKFAERRDRGFSDRKFAERKFDDRKEFPGKKFGDKKFGDKKFGDKKFSDRKPKGSVGGAKFAKTATAAKGVDAPFKKKEKDFSKKKNVSKAPTFSTFKLFTPEG